MRTKTWLIAVLLAGSGFCALVYQVAWLREFRLIFGASTLASAAVLAIFIGGLGIGGLLLGPRADRQIRPLRFYATLEAVVAVSAAATPLLLSVVRALYLASGGSARLGGLVATVGRLALSALVLAIPTLAMGATLPAAAGAATRDTDARRQDVAALYALNTLGAVVGCLAATFWLLEAVGTHNTIWMAAAGNIGVAAAAWIVDRMVMSDVRLETGNVRLKPEATNDSEAPVASAKTKAARAGARGTRHAPQHQAPQRASTSAPQHPSTSAPQHPSTSAPVWFLLLGSGTVGFAFFLMELVWYRLLGPLLGGSVFTFGLILAVALAGVGLGGLVYALAGNDKPASLSAFGTTCLVEAVAVAGTYALGDRVAFLTITLLPFESTGFDARIAGWTFIATLIVLPPALVAGYQFPLLIALFGRARESVGRQIGLAYAANTVGAIAGSLAGGFGLLPWLSAVGAWRLVAVGLAVLGAAAVFRDLGRLTFGGVLKPLALAAIAIACTTAIGPTSAWRHSGIGAGRVSPAQVFASPNQFRSWASEQRRGILWEADGIESTVALTLDPAGYAFVINGKSDGSARTDAGTQVMPGLIGALTVPNPKSALVIGLGTGSTAGWLGTVPSIDRVDVVELEPLVVEVARACALVNRDALSNPKVHVTIGDARELLLTTRERYDIIASEPSNPYRAGIASLFTSEYYRAASDRLSDDGVFVQWVQAYEISANTLRTVYATLASVFPQVETWHTNPGDIVLVASKRTHAYAVADLTRRLNSEPFKSALAKVWRAVSIEGFLAHYLANQSLARLAANTPGVEINTDDRNVVEFGLARSVGAALTTVADIRTVAREAGASRPPLDTDSAIRWTELDTAWMSYNASVNSINPNLSGPPNEQARQAALLQYYQNSNLDAARGLWEQQPDGARDPAEMAMLADIASQSGVEAAVLFIDRLRAYQPGEADVMLGILRLRQSKLAESATAIESALVRFRTDPWTQSRYVYRALDVAMLLATRDTELARRMFAALGSPFAVDAAEDARLVTRAQVSRQLDLRGLCVAAVGALEPHVPWNEPFLRLRRDCYEATSNPLLQTAASDLDEFLKTAPRPIVSAP